MRQLRAYITLNSEVLLNQAVVTAVLRHLRNTGVTRNGTIIHGVVTIVAKRRAVPYVHRVASDGAFQRTRRNSTTIIIGVVHAAVVIGVVDAIVARVNGCTTGGHYTAIVRAICIIAQIITISRIGSVGAVIALINRSTPRSQRTTVTRAVIAIRGVIRVIDAVVVVGISGVNAVIATVAVVVVAVVVVGIGGINTVVTAVGVVVVV